MESEACGASNGRVHERLEATAEPFSSMEDYTRQLHPNLNANSSLVRGVYSQISDTSSANPDGFGLPPVLLLLSPEVGRCEVSVLDLTAWSSSPPWSGYRLQDAPGFTGRRAPLSAPAYQSIYYQAKVEAKQTGTPASSAEYTTNDQAIFVDTEGDAGDSGLAPVQPTSSAASVTLPAHITTHPSPAARPTIRSVAVTPFRGPRGALGSFDSPAGSTSTSGTFRSCLRPVRTWPAGKRTPTPQVDMRPTKTVRWIDHVAQQAVAEAQSAASCLCDTTSMLVGERNLATEQAPADSVFIAKSTCKGLFGTEGHAALHLSALSFPGGLGCLKSGCPLGSLEATASRQGEATSENEFSGAAVVAGTPRSNLPPRSQSSSYTQSSSLHDLIPSSTAGHAQQVEEEQRQHGQQLLLHRFLSPQMLRALEHSQPISEMYIFNRSDSSDPSILVVQPRYDVAAAEAAEDAALGSSCRVPMNWIADDYFGDHFDGLTVDENENRSGLISVLSSSDSGGCGDPCTELGGLDACWEQQYLPQNMQQQKQETTGPASKQAVGKGQDGDSSSGGGGGGGAAGIGGGGVWSPGADDVVGSTCGAPGSTLLLQTHSTTSASFGFGRVGLLSSDVVTGGGSAGGGTSGAGMIGEVFRTERYPTWTSRVVALADAGGDGPCTLTAHEYDCIPYVAQVTLDGTGTERDQGDGGAAGRVHHGVNNLSVVSRGADNGLVSLSSSAPPFESHKVEVDSELIRCDGGDGAAPVPGQQPCVTVLGAIHLRVTEPNAMTAVAKALEAEAASAESVPEGRRQQFARRPLALSSQRNLGFAGDKATTAATAGCSTDAAVKRPHPCRGPRRDDDDDETGDANEDKSTARSGLLWRMMTVLTCSADSQAFCAAGEG